MPFASLPNLHPALVHFPLALLPIAVLLDLLSLLLRRRRWPDRAAAALYALGAIGAAAAYLSGDEAEDGLGRLPPPSLLLVADHADWAWRTLWIFAALASARIVLAWRARRDGAARVRVLRACLLAVAAGGLWSLVGTAERGGALVYRHGIAVARPQEPVKPAAPGGGSASATPDHAGLTRGPDGSLVWHPLPGDEAAFHSIARAVRGGPATCAVVGHGEEGDRDGGGPGLGLRISGATLLAIPGAFRDVQVEATLDPSGYQGAIGLAHGIRENGDAGIFQVTATGGAALLRITGGASRTLARGRAPAPRGPVVLTMSVAGSHLKGLIDGALVVHGHAAPEGAGQTGLFFDGSGTVRVLELKAVPLGPS
jgi:uncharacterized membrane protein